MNKDISLDGFEKWIRGEQAQRNEQHPEDLSGAEVSSKIKSLSKLMNKIEIEDGLEEEVCNEFLEDGGLVIGNKNKSYLVEVTCGSFYLNRNYLQKTQ